MEINAQKKGFCLYPFSQEDKDELIKIIDNQIVKLKVTTHKKPRSIMQNRWIHAIFRQVALNSQHPDWNTPKDVKRNVKMAMKFFKDEVTVIKNRVYFELRSFNFQDMEQDEANQVYEKAKNICAGHLGVDPQTLEREAKQEW